MERSNHRVRHMPTQQLLEQAVTLLLEAKLRPDLAHLHEARASRLYRELARRADEFEGHAPTCTCAECMIDVHFATGADADPF